MTPRLAIQDLTVTFGGITVLDQVSLSVAPGERVALLGPNGCGKSTLFNAVTGATPLKSGQLSLDGRDIRRDEPHWISARGVARCFQTPRVFGRSTVRENIRPTSPHDKATIDRLLVIGDLSAKAEFLGADLTLSELRRVEILRALATNPRLLLLDEPTAGLSAQEGEALMALLDEQLPQDCAVIIIEHRVDLIAAFVSRAIVLKSGRAIADGSFERVRQSAPVLETYLGRAA